MRIFKTSITATLASAILFTPVVAVSCNDAKPKENSSKKNFDKKYDFSTKIDWSKFPQAEEVEVTKWIDGDTLTVKKADGTTNNLRISEIDTPETHVASSGSSTGWSDTSGSEHDYGIKALKYAELEIPKGSKIKVSFEPGETYGRWVGSVFYGKNFGQNYETNIVKQGLALPFMTSINYATVSSDTSIIHYIGVPIADAYNYALENKKGLFEKNIKEVLKVHGLTDLRAVEYNTAKPTSIYHYLGVDIWED